MKAIGNSIVLYAMVHVIGSSAAQANVTVVSPFGNDPVTAIVNRDPGDTLMWVSWKNNTTGACAFTQVGGSSGLSDNLVVKTGSGSDTLSTRYGASFNGSGGLTFCGYTVEEPILNGYFVNFQAEGGNDYLGSGLSGTYHLYSGAGNDQMWLDTPGSAMGSGGSDSLFGGTSVTSSGTSRTFWSHEGSDCLDISTGMSPAPTMGCGADSDWWSGPGTKPSDCENSFTPSCTSYCPGAPPC